VFTQRKQKKKARNRGEKVCHTTFINIDVERRDCFPCRQDSTHYSKEGAMGPTLTKLNVRDNIKKRLLLIKLNLRVSTVEVMKTISIGI
jgi:hypothetical protein